MKKILTAILTCSTAALALDGHATIRRVNSNLQYTLIPIGATESFVYSTLSAAVGAAADGDTIHVEPAATAYGTNTPITKRLVIIGSGYKLGPTQNPGLQFNTVTSKINGLVLNAGSSDTQIMGIEFVTGGLTINSVSGILVDRCFFNAENISISGATVSNITISRCYLQSITQPTTNQAVSNLLIKNNYFSGRILFDDTGDTFTNLLVLNNTFNYGTAAQTMYNATFNFNILVVGSVVLNNNIMENNIAGSGTGIPAAAGPTNVNGVIMANQFVGTGSDDARWRLQTSPASPYLNHNGFHLGMYGGSTPYILSGIPAVPTVYFLSTPVYAPLGGDLPLTISTKSNN